LISPPERVRELLAKENATVSAPHGEMIIEKK
jgi:hypothetical protein